MNLLLRYAEHLGNWKEYKMKYDMQMWHTMVRCIVASQVYRNTHISADSPEWIMNAYANGVCGRGEHPGARARADTIHRGDLPHLNWVWLSARSASAAELPLLRCVFSILFRGAWGARRFYGSLSALQVVRRIICRVWAGCLAGLFLATSAPAADQRRTLVYINSYTMICLYLFVPTHARRTYTCCCTAMHTSCERRCTQTLAIREHTTLRQQWRKSQSKTYFQTMYFQPCS